MMKIIVYNAVHDFSIYICNNLTSKVVIQNDILLALDHQAKKNLVNIC